MTPDTTSRDAILGRLRAVLGQATPQPKFVPTPVLQVHGDRRDWARQFGENLRGVGGSWDLVEQGTAASHVLRLIEQWSDERAVLAWDPETLPVRDLGQLLSASGITIHVPGDMHEGTTRARAAEARVGITGVDAAIATTGSLVLVPGPGKSRAASLLPLHHIALVPMSKIYPTLETWLASSIPGDLERLLVESGQVVFVTGPSKSADIELRLTLGVHGPRVVHALVFDDVTFRRNGAPAASPGPR